MYASITHFKLPRIPAVYFVIVFSTIFEVMNYYYVQITFTQL